LGKEIVNHHHVFDQPGATSCEPEDFSRGGSLAACPAAIGREASPDIF
jgi:hypothetical protein